MSAMTSRDSVNTHDGFEMWKAAMERIEDTDDALAIERSWEAVDAAERRIIDDHTPTPENLNSH